MTDENKNEDKVQDERTPNEIAAETQGMLESDEGREVKATPEYTPGEAEEVEGDDRAAEVTRGILEKTEELSESEPAQAFDHAVETVMETLDEGSETHVPSLHHHYTDEVAIPIIGTVTLPGGVYTAVFIALGVFTLLEVITAELFATSGIKIVLLMGMAVAKAFLVIWFYMHLNRDARSNPLLYVVLLLPLTVTLLSILYLLGVPSFGGLGYGAV